MKGVGRGGGLGWGGGVISLVIFIQFRNVDIPITLD